MNIVLVNLHSARNLGDDGIMAATLTGLEAIFPEARITVAANDPESWRKYEQVRVRGSLCTWVADCRMGRWRAGIWRMPLVLLSLVFYALLFRLFKRRPGRRSAAQQALLTAYYEADLVLSCGGGNFYAHHCPSPGFFWALMAIAFPLALGKQVVMLPQSVGPVVGWGQRALTRLVLRRVSLLMLREERSLRFVQGTLGLAVPAVVLPDLAFGLGRGQEAAGAANGRPLAIGLTIMDRQAQMKGFANQRQYEEALLALLVALHERQGVQAHIFVQCYGPSADQDDRPVSRRLYEQVRAAGVPVTLHEGFQDARQLLAAYGQMDCMVATRMHTGIFALSQGVPTVMIAYQPKAKGVMASFGLDEYCLDIAQVTPEALQATVEQVLANRPVLQEHIRAQYQAMQPQLCRWTQLLREAV